MSKPRPGIGTDECKEWLYKNSFHYRGDFHVQFGGGNGSIVDLSEILLDFAAYIEAKAVGSREGLKPCGHPLGMLCTHELQKNKE